MKQVTKVIVVNVLLIGFMIVLAELVFGNWVPFLYRKLTGGTELTNRYYKRSTGTAPTKPRTILRRKVRNLDEAILL